MDDLVADDLVDKWQKDLKRSKSKQTELMMSGRKGKENISIREVTGKDLRKLPLPGICDQPRRRIRRRCRELS